MDMSFHATTICAVRHNGKGAIAGDGQVTFGNSVVMKQTAKKCADCIVVRSLRDLRVRWQMLSRYLKSSKIS